MRAFFTGSIFSLQFYVSPPSLPFLPSISLESNPLSPLQALHLLLQNHRFPAYIEIIYSYTWVTTIQVYIQAKGKRAKQRSNRSSSSNKNEMLTTCLCVDRNNVMCIFWINSCVRLFFLLIFKKICKFEKSIYSKVL